MKLHQYNEMMRHLTRPQEDPSLKQQVAGVPLGEGDLFGAPERVPMPNIQDLIREEGVQVGPQVKEGGRIGFKHGGSWADWMSNHSDQMSFEEYLQIDMDKPVHPINKSAGGRVYDTRKYFNRGQLVQPGPGRQGYQGKPRKLRVELTADQTVEFRKRVENLATFNDQPKPNWKEHPNLGYDYADLAMRTEYDMATDAKRNLLKGRKPQKLKFLSKPDQDLIKSKFTLPENVKDWNFKEYKYGLPQTTPKGENYKLGQSVRNYIVNKHHFNYGFADYGTRNYHLFQMGRASKKYPKLYVPIYQNKKVIGFIDNTPTGKGEEYYHADYKKGKTILQHPDAKKLGNIRKVIEKMNKNFADTADNIFAKQGYKNMSEVMDDFQKIEGRADIPSGIAQHHPSGTKEAGKTVLLTRDANMFAENVKKAVNRKVNPISIEEADKLLKDKGIPYEINGKKLGKWGISPEKQYKDWLKGLERKFLSGKTTFQEFPKFKSFKEFLNNNYKGAGQLTHTILNSDKKFSQKLKEVCFKGGGKVLASGGRAGFGTPICGAEFAKQKPREFINAVNKIEGAEDFVKSAKGLEAGRKFLTALKTGKMASRLYTWSNPLTLIGGELWYSWLAGRNEWTKGASMSEAINEGLWFVPGKESRDIERLLGPDKTRREDGRMGKVIADKDRENYYQLFAMGENLNEQTALGSQLNEQQYNTFQKQNLKDKMLHAARFDPDTFNKNLATQNPSYFENLESTIGQSNRTAQTIQKRLTDKEEEAQKLWETYSADKPTQEEQAMPYVNLRNKAQTFIRDKFHKKRTWTSADPYSGEEWNWMKRNLWERPAGALDLSEQALVQRQKKLDELTKDSPNWKELERFWEQETGGKGLTIYDKQNLPPELIENFLTKYPDLNYIFPEHATGGRVGFGAGGIDKGRRAFMKWLAGITGAGIAAGTGLIKFGKFTGKGKTVIKAGDHIIQGTKGMPDWFIPLVNRITKEGDDVTAKLGHIEREIVHTKKIGKGEEVTVYQDMNNGNIRVEYESPHNMGEAPIQLEYRAGEVIESGKYRGKTTKSEFEAVESEPVSHTMGPDDYAIEWDGENVVGRAEDLMSDTNKLKQFAKKKNPTMGDIVESSKKKKAVQKIHKNESDYIVEKQGDYDDYLPDIDDLD